jgi:hypothetical protein
MKIYSANLTGSTQIFGPTIISDLTVSNNITFASASVAIPSVTGSFTIEGSGSVDPYFFLIKNEDTEYFKVNTEGVTVLATMSAAPTAVQAGMYFDNTGNFYVGL